MRDRKRSRGFWGGIGDIEADPLEKRGSPLEKRGIFPDPHSGRLQRKLAGSGGLTLIEMLCATFILTLLCVMLSTGLAAAAHDYRMLTGEAETELLLDTIAGAMTNKLRGSELCVKKESDGSSTYSHSYEFTAAGPQADITEPAEGTVVIRENRSGKQNILLPDGAYGAVFSEDDAGCKIRRYEVVSVSVSASVKDASGVEFDIPPDGKSEHFVPGGIVTYTIQLEVKDRVTGVSKTTPVDGIAVRCLNPVKEI